MSESKTKKDAEKTPDYEALEEQEDLAAIAEREGEREIPYEELLRSLELS